MTVGAVALAPLFVLAVPSADRVSASTPAAAPAEIAPGASGAYIPPASAFVPASSRGLAGDAGRRAHTNYTLRNPTGLPPRSLRDLAVPEPPANPPANGITTTEYPASLACLYGMGKDYPGCVPTNNGAYNAKGGERAIALVLAFDNPTAQADLAYFASFFGLPKPKFTKVLATGNGSCNVPPYDAGWAFESAIDTQWSFAMAPKAQIILVEACSNSFADLMYAEQVAEQQVLAYGGGQISNSWGSAEFPTESDDWDWVFRQYFTVGTSISFFFASGDAGLGAEYPSVSPWVVSAGGTTIVRDPNSQFFQEETCWAGSGGGTSVYETYSISFGSGTGPWGNFQYPLFGMSSRRTPDLSFDADSASGAYVRSDGAWYVAGGTSLAAPALAGIVNNSGNRLGIAPSFGGFYSNMENSLVYAQLFASKAYSANFFDVKVGSNGANAQPGWDYCTGVGTPRGRAGK